MRPAVAAATLAATEPSPPPSPPDASTSSSSTILRLAYTSVLSASDEDDANHRLAVIFTQSARNNPPQGIGGILYFSPLTCALMQILEGPAPAVEALFQTISEDTRHHNVRRISHELVAERRYPQFGMKSGVQGDWLELKSDRDVAPDWAQLQGQTELLRLTYSSVLTAEREDVDDTIACILEQSVKNNRPAMIGGALFFNRDTLQLIQLLEGPAAAVRQLYERISKDKRHKLCSTLSEEIVKARMYDEWGMSLSGDSSITSLQAPAWVRGAKYDWENLEGGLSKSFKRDPNVGPARRPSTKRVAPISPPLSREGSLLSVLPEPSSDSERDSARDSAALLEFARRSGGPLDALPELEPLKTGLVLGYKSLVPDDVVMIKETERAAGTKDLPVDASARPAGPRGQRRARGGFGCCGGASLDVADEPCMARA